MNGDRLAVARARYAAEITRWLRDGGDFDPRVEAAFAEVPRESFLTPPPWRVFGAGAMADGVTDDPAALYADVLVVLDRDRGINNGQPSLHAAWLSAVSPQPGERIVQVGVGAGYYTALMAELVGEGSRVEAYEIEERLAALATRNLAAYRQVSVHAASGVGRELPPADVVYVSAGAASPDAGWLACLREGGRLIFPWQPDRSGGTTALLTRVGQGFRARFLMDVSFVGCVGAGPSEQGRGPTPSPASVQNTHSVWPTATRPPDGSATAVFRDVWFSSEPI